MVAYSVCEIEIKEIMCVKHVIILQCLMLKYSGRAIIISCLISLH